MCIASNGPRRVPSPGQRQRLDLQPQPFVGPPGPRARRTHLASPRDGRPRRPIKGANCRREEALDHPGPRAVPPAVRKNRKIAMEKFTKVTRPWRAAGLRQKTSITDLIHQESSGWSATPAARGWGPLLLSSRSRFQAGRQREKPRLRVSTRRPYRDSPIILSAENFGCGSSREGRGCGRCRHGRGRR